MDILRGGIYLAQGQASSTVGLLVVSNNTANKNYENVTVVPVLDRKPALSVQVESGNVDYSLILQIPKLRLERHTSTLDDRELLSVSGAIADLLLIPELCARPPRIPETPNNRNSNYPRWGEIYYAEPPLGGQTKRWLVVSHDHFNSIQGRSICVRTTSRTDFPIDEVPLIQAGFAAAVCPDLTNKEHEMFDLESAERLEQAKLRDMTPVARSMANYLSLQAQAGYS